MDLKKFEEIAQSMRPELEGFLNKLDETVPRGLSRIVAEEDAKVWQEVDCTTCANCCKTMTPVFTRADIKRIATYLKMSPKAFYDKWLMKEEDSGNIVNVLQPCQFLIDDKCSIYEVRPRDCAEFPHHNKKPFDLYNDTFIQNLHRCPATLNLINRLKNRIASEYEWD
jgi:Fe-S-cluster containining protein